MLSYLCGKIRYLTSNFVILNINGIGYKVFITPRTFTFLKKQKENIQIELFTYFYLHEDTQELYGFLTYEELEFFELITSVQGIGPRAALNIMSEAPILEIKKALKCGDVDFFDRIPGIGRKKAKRFILELQDKISYLLQKGRVERSDFNEIISALKNLGYKEKEVRQVLREIPSDIQGIDKKIKFALKILGKK